MKKELLMNRRSVLKGSALMLGALAAPAIISKKALASSGELNFTGWAGYPAFAETVFPAFTAATGITVNFTEQPDQDTMFAQGKVALQSGGIDMIEPTIDRVGAWASDQSRPLADRETLIEAVGRETARFDGQDVPRPPRWSGWSTRCLKAWCGTATMAFKNG